jgi:hypothetical protein
MLHAGESARPETSQADLCLHRATPGSRVQERSEELQGHLLSEVLGAPDLPLASPAREIEQAVSMDPVPGLPAIHASPRR